MRIFMDELLFSQPTLCFVPFRCMFVRCLMHFVVVYPFPPSFPLIYCRSLKVSHSRLPNQFLSCSARSLSRSPCLLVLLPLCSSVSFPFCIINLISLRKAAT